MKYLRRWLTRLLIDRQALRSMVRDEVELYMARNPKATKGDVEDAIVGTIERTTF